MYNDDFYVNVKKKFGGKAVGLPFQVVSKVVMP